MKREIFDLLETAAEENVQFVWQISLSEVVRGTFVLVSVSAAEDIPASQFIITTYLTLELNKHHTLSANMLDTSSMLHTIFCTLHFCHKIWKMYVDIK